MKKSGLKYKNNVQEKLVVISGINLFEGGPLSIYYDFLDNLLQLSFVKKYRIVAFVHKKSLFNRYSDCDIEFIELPKSRNNYLYRLYYEYFFFKKYSRKSNVFCWISLHDITPNVKAEKLFTYCHNPSPFRKLTKIDFKCGIKNVLFPLLYGLIYRINIKKNTSVIVQQEWMRTEFIKKYNIKNVIVAYPEFCREFLKTSVINEQNKQTCSFIYPSFPRTFKNFEVICRAAELLESDNIQFKVFFTLTGNENKYARWLFKHFSHIKSIIWLGLLSRQQLFEKYSEVDCLIFPSLIETWGLPITEFKNTSKPILLSNHSYAHETIGDYDRVSFFEPNDYLKLADLMKGVALKTIVFDGSSKREPKPIYKRGWKDLICYLLDESED